MKQNIVSFSGGRTSAYMVHLIERMRREGTIDNVHYVFMDTGAEHPKTYEFVKKCAEHFKIKLTCLRAVMTPAFEGTGIRYKEIDIDDCKFDMEPWVDLLTCYHAPKITMPNCTTSMKTNPYDAWVKDNFGHPSNTVTWLGIRIDEPRRLREKKNIRYLAEISQMDKQDIIGWWGDMPFDLEMDTNHLGNCVFCVKKATNKLALAARDEPELYKQFTTMLNETNIRMTKGQIERNDNPRGMYRDYMTLEQIVEAYADVDRDRMIARQNRSENACSESCEVFGCQVDMFNEP